MQGEMQSGGSRIEACTNPSMALLISSCVSLTITQGNRHRLRAHAVFARGSLRCSTLLLGEDRPRRIVAADLWAARRGTDHRLVHTAAASEERERTSGSRHQLTWGTLSAPTTATRRWSCVVTVVTVNPRTRSSIADGGLYGRR